LYRQYYQERVEPVKVSMESRTLGNYRILEKIGAGGMGSVYRAHDMSLEREVAIKIISPELARNPNLMARFRVEAIAQARLNHSNIVTIHSFDQQGETYYIVMEYVPGTTLKTLIEEKGTIPVSQALHIAGGILDGLDYAHARGVLHRDIKPANIFITPARDVKLGDFGIAKVEGIDGLTRVGSTLGTLLYSSPEQLRGEKMNAATDIYSLGATLYEMVAGKPPFTSPTNSNYEIQLGHLEKIPVKPSALKSKIPADVDILILKSLAKPTADRYRSAEAFKKAVEQVLAGAPAPGKKTTGELKGRALNPLPGFKIPKIKLSSLKLPAMDTSKIKNINKKIRGIKDSLYRSRISPGGRVLDKRQMAILLLSLLIFLFIVIIAFADNPPKPNTAPPAAIQRRMATYLPKNNTLIARRAIESFDQAFSKVWPPAGLPEAIINEHSLKK
jgi:serine/threonine protein kinase